MPGKVINPEGQCALCGEVLTRRKAATHLQKCRAANPLPEGKHTTLIYTLLVTAPGSPEYFLYIEIGGGASLVKLDDILRATWLDPFDHLSAFTIRKQHYNSQVDDGFISMFREAQRNMSAKIAEVLREDEKFDYQYDFGSTTWLALHVVGVRETRENPISLPVVLMRNLPPKWKCCKCGQPATMIGCGGYGSGEDNVFCDACAQEDECFPIVNSPRFGE